MNLNPYTCYVVYTTSYTIVSIPIRDLMNLNPYDLPIANFFCTVSIPIRDLMNLNQYPGYPAHHLYHLVSIPIRDLMNLNRKILGILSQKPVFQSLLGI